VRSTIAAVAVIAVSAITHASVPTEVGAGLGRTPSIQPLPQISPEAMSSPPLKGSGWSTVGGHSCSMSKWTQSGHRGLA
jgi:hypothetical protein